LEAEWTPLSDVESIFRQKFDLISENPTQEAQIS
jgi:hypothetical protein